MIKHPSLQIVRQILLPDIVVGKIMGILIPGSVSQLCGALVMLILEMDSNVIKLS